jgi:hypothetical protein
MLGGGGGMRYGTIINQDVPGVAYAHHWGTAHTARPAWVLCTGAARRRPN